MEKVLCCPNCKSEDFILSETDKDMAVCNNCENEFYTLDYYENKFIKLEKIFSIVSGTSITLLVIGVILLIFNIYMAETYKTNSLIMFLESIGLNEAACFVFGVVVLSVALVLVYILFAIRKMISKTARSRHFMRKRGMKDKI